MEIRLLERAARPARIGAVALGAGLCSCRIPDYYELSPYLGEGSLDPRGAGTVDGEHWGLMGTVGWLGGASAQAADTMARLDVSKSGELTLREPPTTVHVDAGKPSSSGILGTGIKAPSAPKTSDEGLGVLYWASGLALLIFAAVYARARVTKKPKAS